MSTCSAAGILFAAADRSWEGALVVDAFKATLASDATLLQGLRRSLTSWLDGVGTSLEARDAIVLATHEATARAIENGVVGGTINVTASTDADDCVVVRVMDDGGWRVPEPNGDGRIPVFAQLMSDVACRTHTTLRMTKDV